MDILVAVLLLTLLMMVGALALGLYQLWENIKWGRELDEELKRLRDGNHGQA